MNKKTVIFLIWILISGIFYYELSKSQKDLPKTYVARVIDGDTIEISGGKKIRLKGINAPEKGMGNFEEAKIFLENLVQNKSVSVDVSSVDKYGRILGHVFLDGVYINGEIVRNGLAHSFEYESDAYSKKIKNFEREARRLGMGIWKTSKNKDCVEILNFNFTEKNGRCSNGERLEIKNKCKIELSITIKDEATHVYKEKISPLGELSKNFSCVFNDEGDSLFIWDADGLVYYWGY